MKQVVARVDGRGLKAKMGNLDRGRVLIVGDVGVDEYVLGEVRRISPEAPVPVLEVTDEHSRLGLAANVAQNIVSLGGEPLLVSVLGDDSGRRKLCELLKVSAVSDQYLIVDHERPTTRKLRMMSGPHHIVRVDYERRRFLSPKMEAQVLDQVKAVIKDSSVVLLQDYAKGVLSEQLIQSVIRVAKEHNKPVLVDPHISADCRSYRGADLMTPNRNEAFKLSGLAIDDLREKSDTLLEVGSQLMRTIGSQQMVITRGPEGMTLFENGIAEHLPTFAKQVSDVTGAGDTVIAAIALGWGTGLSLPEACQLANAAAGVVVAKLGAATCSREELAHALDSL